MSNDIRDMLTDWAFEPNQVTVRKIIGNDAREKIQLRLDLGLLQMEMSGRPDGVRPNGDESLLVGHMARLAVYHEKNGTDLGFELTSEECDALRAEAIMYYHRYLALFVLEDFECVERDTARNLQVFDLMHKYAADKADRVTSEPYRPYVVMMHTRAKASMAMGLKAYRSALAHADAGLRAIREFLESYGHGESFEKSAEVMILKALREEIVEQMPVEPLAKLERDLTTAVDGEQYEEAARLRDEIALLRDDALGESAGETH